MTLKQRIIERVNSIEDENILNEIFSLISAEKDFETVYEFSPSELQFVNEGIEDANKGRSYSQEETEKLVAKWLQEKSDGL
tara:strand:+ start:215 stop:457 length:243 start_codon:yes stop_codon:yes gene_type:complete